MKDNSFIAAEYEQICESYNDNRRIFIQVVVFLAVRVKDQLCRRTNVKIEAHRLLSLLRVPMSYC